MFKGYRCLPIKQYLCLAICFCEVLFFGKLNMHDDIDNGIQKTCCSMQYVCPYMGHRQYLAYSSKSSIFEECIIVFQVWGYYPNGASKLKLPYIYPICGNQFVCNCN